MQAPSSIDPDCEAVPNRPAGRRFCTETRGEVALEYGLIVALIVVALIAALPVFGNASRGLYNRISNAMVNGSP